MSEIDDATSRQREEATYAIYRRLHAAQGAYPAKALRTVISELMYAEPFAWRAVGITRAALAAYLQAGKNRIKGIERAHLTDRYKMVLHVLDSLEPMERNELFAYWRETDRVVIALTSENRSNDLGDWIPFDNDDAHFFPRLGIGFNFRSAVEGELMRQLNDAVG